MTGPFAAAVAAALFAEAELGRPLWSTPDGHRAYGQDTSDGVELIVDGPGGRVVTRVTGVHLGAFT